MHEHSSWYGKMLLPTTITSEDTEARFQTDNSYVGWLGTMQTEFATKDVLVVDDDPHLCEIITDVLEAEGHTARMAANGVEALQRIRERKPQLILLDLMMPIMNGWELANTLKGNPEWSDIPIVLVTAAHGSINSQQQDTNARAVIRKPFDIDALTQVVLTYAQ